MDVATIKEFGFLDHDHIGTFKVEKDSFGVDRSDDDAHSFCLAGEGEVGEDFVFLEGVDGGSYGYVGLLSLAEEETEGLGEFDEGYLVWTRGLEHSYAIIIDWVDIVAHNQGRTSISYITFLPSFDFLLISLI